MLPPPPPLQNEGGTRGSPAAQEGGPDKGRQKQKKKKKKRSRSNTPDDAILVSDEEGDLAKQPRAGNQAVVRSPKLQLEGLNEVDFDRFKDEPLEVAADVCKAASNLLKRFKKDKEKRFTELKKERDQAVSKAKEASDALKEVEKKLEDLVTSSAKETKDADAQLARIEQKAHKYEGAITKLRGEVKTLEGAVGEAKMEKEIAEATLQTVAGEAVTMSHNQFKNALEQVKYCFPEIQIDPAIIDVEHEV